MAQQKSVIIKDSNSMFEKRVCPSCGSARVVPYGNSMFICKRCDHMLEKVIE